MDLAEQGWYRKSPLFVQNAVVSAHGLYSRVARGGPSFRRALAELLESQWFSEEAFAEIQNARLAALVEHCYRRVPYYRNVMRERGLSPSDITTVDDLPKLPLLTKEDVRTRAAELVREDLGRAPVSIGNTSGTTGTPLRLVRDHPSVVFEQATIWRHWTIDGLPLWGRRAKLQGDSILPSGANEPPFWRTNAPENQLVMSSFHISLETAPHYARALRAFAPRAITAYPSSVYFLAKTLLELDERVEVPLIFTNSEPVYAKQREVIEEAFSGKVYDVYGQAERVVYAMECPERTGLHVAPEYGVLELVEPEGGDAGGLLEVVGTSLANYAMPLLRYRVGDLARPLETGCACGRKMPLLSGIETRVSDMILTPEGRQLPFSGMTHAFMGLRHIRKSQLVQDAVDHIHVKVVPGDAFSEDDRRAMVERITNYVGERVRIDTELVDEIDRDASGKFRWIVSKVNPADWMDANG